MTKEFIDKLANEPVFLLEMSHSLRHLILKRGYMFRSGRGYALLPLAKAGSKSWLEAKLIPCSDKRSEKSWEKAHELAEKLKRELHKDVYVEPCSRPGRYQAIIGQGGARTTANTQADSKSMMPDPLASTHFATGSTTAAGMRGVFGGPGMAPNRNEMGFCAGIGKPAIGMTQVPNPMTHLTNGLPPQAAALMNSHQKVQSDDVSCPALRPLPGWSELSETKRQMFETEAAQLIKNGLTFEIGAKAPKPKRSTLDLVRLQPQVSRMLKHFLEQALQPVQQD